MFALYIDVMKKYFIASIFFVVQLFPQQSWIQLTSPVKNDFVSLSVIDSLNVFVAGDSGKILKTANGGNSWQVLNFPSDKTVNDIFFYSANHGWAITMNVLSPPFGSNIFYTNNGGQSWSEASRFFEDIFLTTISFYDSLNGICGSASGDMIKSSDGGINWDVVEDTVITGLPILSLNYHSPKFVFGSGGHIDFAGGIFSSSDYGASWNLKLVGPEPIQHLHVFDSLNIIGVGGDYEFGTGVVSTSDGGANWIYKSLSFFGIAVAVSFKDRSEGWATLGFGKSFMHTTDAGKRWTLVPTPNDISIYDLAFANDKVGYAVGDSGTILKFQMNTVDVEAQKNITPKDFVLCQNYPNPFNASSIIKFTSPFSDYGTVKIYSILGEEVAVLFSDLIESNKGYKIEINSETFSSGIYLCRLQTKQAAKTIKLTIIK